MSNYHIRINQLTETTTLSDGDSIVLFDTSQGSERKASLSTLKAYIEASINATDDKVTQYSAPSATGFSIQVGEGSRFLLISPLASYAEGTIVLPEVSGVQDRTEILVHCTQSVTTLTINANNASISGAPTTISAGDSFRLRFDAVNSSWYRVG